MQVRGFRQIVMLVTATLVVFVGTQALITSCQGTRACRTHKPCYVFQQPSQDASSDAADVFHGFACNFQTALCFNQCTNDEQCDRCNGFTCVSGECKRSQAAIDKKPERCCAETYAKNCGKYTCNTKIGQCRTGECNEDAQCNRCAGFFCDTGSKQCVAAANKPKPDDCPTVEPEPSEQDAGGDDAGGDDTGGDDAGGDDASGGDTSGVE